MGSKALQAAAAAALFLIVGALANTGANVVASIGVALILIGVGTGMASGRRHHQDERGRS